MHIYIYIYTCVLLLSDEFPWPAWKSPTGALWGLPPTHGSAPLPAPCFFHIKPHPQEAFEKSHLTSRTSPKGRCTPSTSTFWAENSTASSASIHNPHVWMLFTYRCVYIYICHAWKLLKRKYQIRMDRAIATLNWPNRWPILLWNRWKHPHRTVPESISCCTRPSRELRSGSGRMAGGKKERSMCSVLDNFRIMNHTVWRIWLSKYVLSAALSNVTHRENTN